MNRANEWRRKKHRAGRKRKSNKDRTRSFMERFVEPEILLEAALPESSAEGVGEITKQPIDTALFERQADAVPDAAMVRQAIRERWGTPKPLSEKVLVKALTLAAGEEWVAPDGQVRKEEWSPPQLIGAAKLALDIERQNQGQDHHVDRMEYYERALQARTRVGEYQPPGTTVNVQAGEGGASVNIYIPNNFRDEVTDEILDVLPIDDQG